MKIGAVCIALAAVIFTEKVLACADGLSCAVVKQTDDGFVALRAEPRPTSQLLLKLQPYQILVIPVSTCAPNPATDPWILVECVPAQDGDCSLKGRKTTGWVNSHPLVPAACPKDMN